MRGCHERVPGDRCDRDESLFLGGGAAEAVTTAAGSVRDIRAAEVTKQDIVVGDGGGLIYRTKIQLSFKYESE